MRGLKRNITDFELTIAVGAATFGIGVRQNFCNCSWIANLSACQICACERGVVF
ncbi:hypothetical protein [Anaerocellum danielii]|uniref:Uncharacterized protein n=1 Tax=Anaerocellum danielii TaxID=1387557 RepID=A0ABZ0U1Y0_9FIRM|nr:hypothetical protein [Caldicellulosiruptor danielii]WPX07730.1 hypothetical protein SOJ16_001558 [Caldicellulosiruptor danielii]